MAKASQAIASNRLAERTNRSEIEKLRAMVVAQSRRTDYLTAQLAEANLKLLYAMQILTVKRATAPSALILPGVPPPVEEGTLLDFYRRERETFLAQMEARHAQSEADAHARAVADDATRAARAAIAEAGANGHAHTLPPA